MLPNTNIMFILCACILLQQSCISEEILWDGSFVYYQCHKKCVFFQGLHRLEKYLNLEGFLEKSLKNKSAMKVLENHSKAFKSS